MPKAKKMSASSEGSPSTFINHLRSRRASQGATAGHHNKRPFDPGIAIFEIDYAPLSVSLFAGSPAQLIHDPWLTFCCDKFSGIGASTITKGPPDKAAVLNCLQSAITKLGAKHERSKTIKGRRTKIPPINIAD